jgi:hypothetical protein
LKFDIGLPSFKKYLKEKHDKRPHLIYNALGQKQDEKFKILNHILNEKGFQIIIGKELFEGGYDEKDIPQNKKHLFTTKKHPKIAFNGKDDAKFFEYQINKDNNVKISSIEKPVYNKMGENDFLELLKELEIASKNKEIIFIKENKEQIKISLSTTRYLAKAGELIKKYIKKEKKTEEFKSLLEVIDKILDLKEKIK